MAFSITLSDAEWALVADLFDPPGAPAQIERRAMVDAMLFLVRTGCQWRYLPTQYPPWGAAGNSGGAGERMACGRERWPAWAVSSGSSTGASRCPRWVVIDAQTVKGGRYGPTYHEAGGWGGRTIGAKRTVRVVPQAYRLPVLLLTLAIAVFGVGFGSGEV